MNDDLVDRLEALEGRFGVGPTHLILAVPGLSKGPDSDPPEWPDGLGREDITHVRQEPGVDGQPIDVEEPMIPYHRPDEYRGGVVMMSYAEIARVWATMPPSVREAELELRIERGDPIPPILQE